MSKTNSNWEDKNSENIGKGQKGNQSALQNFTHLEMLKIGGKRC